MTSAPEFAMCSWRRPAIEVWPKANGPRSTKSSAERSATDLLGRLRRALQPILSGHEALHHLEIAIAQLQTGIRPNLNDAIKLLERDGIDLATDLIDRAAADVPPFAALDIVACLRNPLP